MKVLAAASEIYPLVKTGGLADVVGALPPALAALGVETRTLVPGYPAVTARLSRRAKPLAVYGDLFGGKASLKALKAEGLDLIVLEAPHLYDRHGGPYVDPTGIDWPDNFSRFAALARVAADIAAGSLKGFAPDLLHVHDWQAAMAPAYLRLTTASRVPSVVTIHNIAFQGRFPAALFPGLGLPDTAMTVDGVEYYGGVGFLKAGLQFADAITTVSPTYAEEIRTPRFGMGLEGLIGARADRLHGIVNGIDAAEWDPGADRHLAAAFGPRTLAARARNRKAVETRFGLDAGTGPIFCVISRLTWQKGMDILADVLGELVATGGRLALLGSGDAALEATFTAAAAAHPGRVGTVIGYDEGLSHLLQGGADAILIPSRFEPCGLTQLYGLRYGCVPVVSRTGGLADTVIDANEAAVTAGVATGFVHEADSADALRGAIARATRLFGDRAAWSAIQRQGMRADVSWNRSARRYARLYQMLIEGTG
jgi:starch synthase